MKIQHLLSAILIAVAPMSASVISYTANLDGASESPSNASPGLGFALVTIDDIANTMRVQVTFSGLVATNTAAHIHCCTAAPFTATAGVATTTPTFTGFPGGVTSGSYDHVFDMTLAASYNPTFVTNNGGTAASAEAVLFAGMAAGKTYLNIHSGTFPGGEIRGFLVATPEPGAVSLVGLALAGLFALKRRISA